jgi:hypothetical protein
MDHQLVCVRTIARLLNNCLKLLTLEVLRLEIDVLEVSNMKLGQPSFELSYVRKQLVAIDAAGAL